MAAPRGNLSGLGLVLLLLMCGRGWAAAGSSEAFDSALGSTASCHRACQLTYPLHTYPKVRGPRPLPARASQGTAPPAPALGGSPYTCLEEEELYACQRGCRLFSICQFVDDGIDLNLTKLECDSACTEAYSQSDEQYACHLGCQNQQPFAELRQEQLMSLMPRIHLLFPLTLVRSFWSDMMDSAQSFITSSWTFYLQADDGKIVIFQSKPEVQYVPQDTTDLKESSLSKTSYLQPRGSQTHRGFFEEEESNSFFKCLSINSGWILTTTLVLSVLVLLWICCATVATAAQQYVPSEKLSIYGDLEYMNEKLTRYPASALVVVRCKTDEHEESGPPPTKVNLAHSAI
ncbi:transmembrane protein 59 isoform X2 [Mauremys mutica]|uniref:transmembrane protein 59 isoform X2 n=1 Tax=Mauremys mutica TaxID=74926 RepID=UPI001D15F4F1|nr:transmembrane protein 59 isoform X2 [Mauremys mutica]